MIFCVLVLVCLVAKKMTKSWDVFTNFFFLKQYFSFFEIEFFFNLNADVALFKCQINLFNIILLAM